MASLNNDFEEFFGSLRKEKLSSREIDTICKPLHDYFQRETLKKWSLLALTLVSLFIVLLWCDSCTWFLSALGRELLIQILPFWNWSKLYNTKCLIERASVDLIDNRPSTLKASTDNGNCLLCEHIDYVPTVSNITFSFLENTYLEKGLPVVITDSHDAQNPYDLFQTIFDNSYAFLQSSHCDVSTNLIIRKFFEAQIVLRKAWKLLDTPDKWFIQLRNCQFAAVKSSRLFIKRPYYYPLHLEPFYSSWLIISNNYSHRQYQEILLQGLIIVQQLSGSNNLRLIPKTACEELCPVINIQLKEGEAFLFTTDLWILNYKLMQTKQAGITTIMEIDWSV
ncbi:uncharacterized protein LOC106085178 [Stomoxys calcitrans]|uniref:uncharacterized protein LOC106085178 n=1 Tax=Stomoxys calcitrans TaxID=35570 RepID=UPI0027E34A70|nr:uncharacterized protein LOC106085178 [Stomoxys calcitrans]